LLAKRRGQIKSAIKEMVIKVMGYLDSVDYDTKLDFISVLVSVTEGKIFVEKQRAALTLQLALIKEKEGKIVEAATILQEVQVETFGAMTKQEKLHFILEQMRLCLLKKDYIRTQVISRKVSTKVFDNEAFQALKERYYLLMVDFWHHENNYLEIARCYQHIYNTPNIKKDQEAHKKYLSLMVAYILLAPYDGEQSDIINRIRLDDNLEQLPEFFNLVKLFLNTEILPWTVIDQQYRPLLSKLVAFSGDGSETRWADLKTRVTEHNLRTVAGYYSQITTERLGQLLNTDQDGTEAAIATLVNNKSIYAKINRSQGIVSFVRRSDPAEILNDWGSNVSDLLGRVETVCHLIHRERMTAKAGK